MRVIAGKARSLPLKTVPGMQTRPTTDRIKETLFNILAADLDHCRFLDLFAGSGAIGIEALSRGAACACFVEQSKKAVRCIEENLVFTGLSDAAVVRCQEVLAALQEMNGREDPFDLIFMDPPYSRGLEEKVLAFLNRSALTGTQTKIIVEADLATSFDYLDHLSFYIYKEKIYKTNKHVFMMRRSEE